MPVGCVGVHGARSGKGQLPRATRSSAPGHHFAAVSASQIVKAFEVPAVCLAPASARKTLQNAAKTPISEKSADHRIVRNFVKMYTNTFCE